VISQSRYVKIITGVGAAQTVPERKLILRVVTQNPVIPPGIIIEFSAESAVGSFFGQNSEEYARALAYFTFISKSIKSPALISYARWVNQSIAPTVVGDSFPKSLTALAAFTAGTLTIMSGANAISIGPINLSGAANLTAVAALIQTAVRVSTDSQLTAATVTYNTNTNQFVLTGSVVGAGVISVAPSTLATDISTLTGLATGSTVLVKGQTADTADVAISKSASLSNNFGSFVYVTPTTPFVNADLVAIAAWNASQNNMYMYSLATTLTNMGTLFPLIQGYSGTAINVLSTTAPNDFIEQSPCEILASTDYSQPNSAQNYMFYQFPNRNTTVSDDPTANIADSFRANYIGVTQSAGAPLAFYQRGLLCGGPLDAVDMNIYANEMWLKSTMATTSLGLLMAVPTLPANPTGGGMLLGVYQDVMTQAQANGVFSEGATLTAVQQQFISQVTGDKNAWRQIQTIGYWINITFSSYTNPNTGLVEKQAVYRLVYAKGDAVRLITGSDTLI